MTDSTNALAYMTRYASPEQLVERDALAAEVAKLRAAIKRINQTLCVPAAEYVPAIRDAFDVIDAALAQGGEP